MGRRIALPPKRLELTSIWPDTDAHLLVTPIGFGELSTLTGLQKMDETTALDTMTDLIKNHFVSGRVVVFTDEGEKESADATADDIGQLPIDTLQDIFGTLTGVDLLDPKEQTTQES